jgi:hypothetical protein
LQDVITKPEPELFLDITGLTVKDFHLLVRLKVFNPEQMNQAVFAFRRYEDASLRYTGIQSHEGLTHYGLYDTVGGEGRRAVRSDDTLVAAWAVADTVRERASQKSATSGRYSYGD